MTPIERKAYREALEDAALTRLIKRIEYALDGKTADQFAHRKNHLTRGSMRDILSVLKEKRTLEAENAVLRQELELWMMLVKEGGVPRYTITPGAALNELVTSTRALISERQK